MTKTSHGPRQTIGTDPLDTIIPPAQKSPAPRVGSPKSQPKIRATFHLPVDLLEEARDATVFLAGPPVRLTLASFAETALRRELEHLRKSHNNGKPFPKRRDNLKGGRPIGS